MTNKPKQNDFLPISKSDMRKHGIEQLDFICVTGDSYVDHPTFGTAIISRVIEAGGFSVGILAQPGFRNANDMQKLGRPKYAFMVSSGNIDSMVAHYTVAKRKRSDDAYTAGGKAGRRPDRALTVYCKLIREAYPDIPIIIGGLEASLRRFAHYDYWDDAVHPSILCSTTADLLVYGMGEKQTIEIVHRLASGESVNTMTDIRGTCYLTDPVNTPFTSAQCPDFDAVCRDKKLYAKAAKIQMAEQDEVRGKTIIQRHGKKMLVQNPPMTALDGEELDRIYELPYMRTYHPSYESEGGVPAIKEVEFSITHNRGCFGACNFCSIAFHQGRKVTCRTHESVVREAQEMTKNPHFKGYISDVGGPTANFRQPSCAMQKEHGLCKEKKCLAPRPCKNLIADHSDYVSLLRKLREIKGIKKVFIRSGIRYDYMLCDSDDTFFKELVRYHVSGQLRVAPEHCSANVLDRMGKPHIEAYRIFLKKYREETAKIGKEQYLVPYLMSSHPGSTLNDAIELALFLKEAGIHPDQVQDFYPTPGTVSTCMYYTGIDPISGESVFVPKTPEEKAMQRALLQYYKPENREIVRKALILANRRDLIGNRPGCLIPDQPGHSAKKRTDTAQNKRRTSWQNERRTKNTKRTKQ